jgi:hypothetical protein
MGLTPPLTASRPTVKFRLQQHRHRAAMRCSALVETVEKPQITEISTTKGFYFQ